MVKFAKNGSAVTTAAIELARAATGHDLVAICGTQPFFSTDDWFVGSTQMKAGDLYARAIEAGTTDGLLEGGRSHQRCGSSPSNGGCSASSTSRHGDRSRQ